MKKIFGLLLVCFLLVGCGKTTTNTKEEEQTPTEPTKAEMVCSKYTENTVNFITEMTFYFENNTTIDVGIKYTYDLSAYNEEQRKAFASANMCEMESMETKLGIRECKEELVGSDYVVTGYADKLLEQSKGTLEVLKTSFEKEGWTCVKR